jgi:hypothetical protein
MASAIHPDFWDDITQDEAFAVDNETRNLILEQQQAD